ETSRVRGSLYHREPLCDEFANERRKTLIPSFRPSILDQNISAFLVPAIPQALAKRLDEPSLKGCGGVSEETDHRHRLLLRAGGEGTSGHRAAEEEYQLPAPHPITSSARVVSRQSSGT